MNVFETAFWALKKGLKKPAEQTPPAPAVQESQTEFISRTIDLTPGIPHYNKGMILERRGEKPAAIGAYLEAVKAVPQYFDAHANLTRLLCQAERWDDAIKHGEMAVRLRRNSPRVHNNLCVAFYHKNQVAKAMQHAVAALRLAPGDLDLFENLNDIRKSHPELEQSEVSKDAKQLCLQLAEKHYEEGFVLLSEKKVREAIAFWRLAVRFAPQWADPMCNLAAILAIYPEDSVRSPKEAVDLALKAMQTGDRSPRFYDALAAAYANSGRFLEAQRTIQEILPTLKVKGPLESAEKLSNRLKLYSAQQPLRQELPLFRPPPKPGSQTAFFTRS